MDRHRYILYIFLYYHSPTYATLLTNVCFVVPNETRLILELAFMAKKVTRPPEPAILH